MRDTKKTKELFDALISKAILKQDVYDRTLKALNMLKDGMKDLVKTYESLDTDQSHKIPFVFRDRGQFEAELKFAGDTLVFMMHTNVFELPRDHEVMKTPYIKEDKERSYCGIINIFNFLSDSFKYQRINDSGYLIGRVFINKDLHYFVEENVKLDSCTIVLQTSEMNQKNACKILESAIYYTINFDL
ncbi:MAG: hypothetical protein R2764_00665 [Bacteroidales bacterium]